MCLSSFRLRIKTDMTLKEYKALIDTKLAEYFRADDMPQAGLFEAMRYSLNEAASALDRYSFLSFAG